MSEVFATRLNISLEHGTSRLQLIEGFAVIASMSIRYRGFELIRITASKLPPKLATAFLLQPDCAQIPQRQHSEYHRSCTAETQRFEKLTS